MALADYSAAPFYFFLEAHLGKSADAALALAEAFFRVAPTDKRKRMSEAEWANSLKKFHREAMEIRRRYSLGPFARASAAYQLQKRLLAAGFASDTVRKVVFSLVLSSFSNEG
jgi:hypothetical protein